MREFERLNLLLDTSKIEKLNILIVGLGGVGSYTVESLARCGVGNLTIVDFDTVDITNINRQIIALHSTLGKYKVDVFKERIKDINPKCKVEIVKEKITEENIEMLFSKNYDYIVDACDDLKVKKLLLKLSKEKNRKLMMSMGTANKIDPTKLTITDLSKTNYDPIAKIIRKYVKDNHIKGKIPVVSSIEQPRKLNGKLGSTSFVPSVAGLLITSYIINEVTHD
jgi:tRNA A37 threonylcarbamoyladenosine dehydratase